MDTNSIRLSSTSSVEFLKSVHSISTNLRGFLLEQDQKPNHQHRTKRRKTDDQQPNPSSKAVTVTPNNNHQQQASPIHPVTSLTNGYRFKLGTRNSRNSSKTSFNLEPPVTGTTSSSTRIYNVKQAAEYNLSSSSSLHQSSDSDSNQDSDIQSESESDADSEYQSSSPAEPKPKARRKPSTTNASSEPTTRYDIENQKLMDLSQGLEEIKGELEVVWKDMLDSCKEVRDSKVTSSDSTNTGKIKDQTQLDDNDNIDDENREFRFKLPTLMELSCRNLSIHLDLHCQSSSIDKLETSINQNNDHYFQQMEAIYENLPELGISNLLIVHAFDFMIRHLDEIHQEFKLRKEENVDHSKGKSKGDDEEEIDEWKPDHQGAALGAVARFIRDTSRMVFKKAVEWEWDFEANYIQKRLITTELEKISDFQTKPTPLKQIRNIHFGGHFSSYQGNETASMDYLSKTDFNTFEFGSHDRIKSYLNFHAFRFILENFKINMNKDQRLLNEQFNQVKLLSCLIDAKIYWFKLSQGKLGGKRSIYARIYGGPEESNAEHPNSIRMIKDYEPEKMISSFLQLVFSWISNRRTKNSPFLQREKVELVKKQLMRWMIELFEISLESSEMVFRDGIVEEEESRSIDDRKRLRESSRLAQMILIKVNFELVSLLDRHSSSLSRDSKAVLEEISFCFSIYSLYSLEMERLSDSFQSAESSLDIKKLLKDGSLPNGLKDRDLDENRSNHQEQVQKLVSLISRFKDESEAFSKNQSNSEISSKKKISAEEISIREEEIESDSSSLDPLDSETIPSSPSSTSSSSPGSLSQEKASPSLYQPATFITTIQNLLSILEDSSTFQIGNEESRKQKILSISSSNSLSLFLLSLVLRNLSEVQEETTRSTLKIASNLSILESEALKLSMESEERRHSRNLFFASQWDFYVKREQFEQTEESSERTQRRREWDGDVGDRLYEYNEQSKFIREKLDLWLKRSEERSIELRSKAHRKEVEFDGKRLKKSVRLDHSNELKRGDDEEGEKWRYEELIDAWVLRTPNDVVGNSNVKKQKRKRGQSSKNPVSKSQQARMANREEEDLDFITPKRPTRSSSRIKNANQKDNVSDEEGPSGSIEESDEEEIESDHSGPVLDDESMRSSSPIQVHHSSPAPSRPSKPAFQIISNEEELSLSQNEVGNDEEQDQEADVDDDDDDELNLFNQDTPAPARVRKPPTRFGNLTFSGKGWNKSGSDLVLDEASSALTSSRNGSSFTFDASTQSGKRSSSLISMNKRSRSSLPSFGSNDLDFFNPSLKSRASSSSLRSESQKGNARESISMLLEKQERVKVMERMRRDEDAKLEQAERGFRERKKSRRN